MANSRPGNIERGWNDPPLFFYSTTATAEKSPKKTLLNKRVAYPEVSTETDTSQHRNGGPSSCDTLLKTVESEKKAIVPPLTVNISTNTLNLTPPATKPCDIPIDTTDEHKDIDNTEEDSSKKDPFDLCCTELHNITTYIVETSQKATTYMKDVNRKLDLFKEAWSSGKLCDAVQSKMCDLCKALRSKQWDVAHDIHLELMVDYINEVGKWMVGIKKIIHEAKQLPETSKEKEDTVL